MITDKLKYNITNNNANNITRVISANLEQILQMTHMLSKYLEENKLANAKLSTLCALKPDHQGMKLLKTLLSDWSKIHKQSRGAQGGLLLEQKSALTSCGMSEERGWR